jgi:hypothetical protein
VNDPQREALHRTVTLGTVVALFGVLCVVAILVFGYGG